MPKKYRSTLYFLTYHFAKIYCWRAVAYVWYKNACFPIFCLPLALRSTVLAWVSWNPNTICAARLSPADHPGGMCLWQPAVRGFPCRQILFLKFLTEMSFERFHFVSAFHLLPYWNLETGLPLDASGRCSCTQIKGCRMQVFWSD